MRQLQMRKLRLEKALERSWLARLAPRNSISRPAGSWRAKPRTSFRRLLIEASFARWQQNVWYSHQHQHLGQGRGRGGVLIKMQ